MFWKQLIIVLISLSIFVIIILMYLSNLKNNPLDHQEVLQCLDSSSSYVIGLKNKDNALPRICYERSLKHNSSDHISVLKLSFLYLIEDRPTEAVELIESYHILDDVNSNSFDLEYRNDITCVYLQSLLSLKSWERVESFIGSYLMNNKHNQNECMLLSQNQYFLHKQSYQHALNLSVTFVHNYPELFEAHVLMALSLYNLNRIKEASSVFAIAYSLFNNNIPIINTYVTYFRTSQHHELCHMLSIYGDVLIQQDNTYLAEQVFMQMVSKLITETNIVAIVSLKTCTLLYKLASLQYELEMFPKSYVTVLKYLRYCSLEATNAAILLGNIKDILGLPQYVVPVIDIDIIPSEQLADHPAMKPLQDTDITASTAVEPAVDVSATSQDSHSDRELHSNNTSQVMKDIICSSVIQESEEDLILLDTVPSTLEDDEKSSFDNNIDISNDIINLDKDVQAQVDLLNRKETDQNYSNNVELFLVEEDAAKEEVFEQVLLEPIKEEQVALSSVIEEEQVQVEEEVVVSMKQEVQEQVILSPSEISARKAAKQYLVMAAAYTTRGDFEQAIKQLTKALKKAPNYTDIYMIRGKAYLDMGDSKKASVDYLEVYEKLDRLNTTACEQLLNIATHLSMEGQYSESVILFDKIISNALVSSNEHAVIIYVNTLQALLQFDIALDVLDKYINQNQSQQIIQLYATLYENTKQLDKAEQIWLNAIDRNMASLKDIGDFYSRQNDITKALQTYEKYLSAVNLTLSIYDLASIHKKLGSLYIKIYQQELIETTVLESNILVIVNDDTEINNSSNNTGINNNSTTNNYNTNSSNDTTTDTINNNNTEINNNTTNNTEINNIIEVVDNVSNGLYAVKLLENAQMHYEIAMNYGIYDIEVRKFFATYPVTATNLEEEHIIENSNNEIMDIIDIDKNVDITIPTNVSNISTSTTTDITYEEQQSDFVLSTNPDTPAATTAAATTGSSRFLRRNHDNTIQSESLLLNNKVNNYFRNKHRWIIRPVTSSTSMDLATISSMMNNENIDFDTDISSNNLGLGMKSPGISMSHSGNIANNLMRDIENENQIGGSSSTAFELLMQQQEQLQEQEQIELL